MTIYPPAKSQQALSMSTGVASAETVLEEALGAVPGKLDERLIQLRTMESADRAVEEAQRAYEGISCDLQQMARAKIWQVAYISVD